MSDNYASLGPSLLARKGGAKPAMRRQVGMLPGTGTAAQNLEDLGWNDMGDDADDASAAYQRPADVLQLTPATAGSDDTSSDDDHDDAPVNASQDGPGNDPGNDPGLGAIKAASDTPLLAKKPNVLRQREEIAERIEAKPATSGQAEPLRKAQSVAEIEPSAELPGTTSSRLARASVRGRKPALERGKRAAFTLRLDADRHLKLRLACTLRNRSAQQLVTDALDQLLGKMDDVDTLAAQVRGTD